METDLKDCAVFVSRLELADDLDRLVAKASIQVGPIRINGITVWRSRKGKLDIYFPAKPERGLWIRSVDLPTGLRIAAEAQIIAAYRAAEAEAEAAKLKSQSQNASARHRKRVPQENNTTKGETV